MDQAELHEFGDTNLPTIFQLSDEFFSSRRDCTVEDQATFRIILTEREMARVVGKVAAELDSRYGNDAQAPILVGVLKGAYVFMSDLCKMMKTSYRVSFVMASSYHDGQIQHEQIKLITTLTADEWANDRQIVILDELADNGKTLLTVCDKLLGMGVKRENISTCVLLRKEKPSIYIPDIIGLDHMPDLWLLGYGLDSAQEKRGWPVIYAVPKLPGIPKVPADVIFEEKSKPAEAEEMMRNIRRKIVERLPKS